MYGIILGDAPAAGGAIYYLSPLYIILMHDTASDVQHISFGMPSRFQVDLPRRAQYSGFAKSIDG